MRRAPRPRHGHPPRDDAEPASRPTGSSSRPASGCRPGPSSGPPASPRTRACGRCSSRSTSAAGSRSTITCAVPGFDGRLRGRRLRRGARTPTAASARRPPSTRSARRASRPATWPPTSASAATSPSPTEAAAPFVNLGRYKAVASMPGGVTLSGFPAWWAARTYHVSQIPGLRPQAPSRRRLDDRPAVPPRHGRGRLDRPPAAAPRRGLRARRQPPAAGLDRHAGADGLPRHLPLLRDRDRDRRQEQGLELLRLVRDRRRRCRCSG